MNDWIKNPANQVSEADGKFIALWRGQVVYALDGRARHFETKGEALAFLARCDAAGRMVP